MPTTKRITEQDIENELARMRAELDELKSRPQSPHGEAAAEYERDWQRRVAEGKRTREKERAEEDRFLDENTREWVRIRCSDQARLDLATTTDRSIKWNEIDVEPGPSMYRPLPYDPTLGRQARGEYVATEVEHERVHSLASNGHELITAEEYRARIKRSSGAQSPTLADLVSAGVLIVDPLSRDEAFAVERKLLREAAARPMPYQGVGMQP